MMKFFTARLNDFRPSLSIVILVYAAVFFTFALINTPQHDHALYLIQWEHILEGKPPWADIGIATNAYGPAHNFLALAYAIWPLLPKAIFAFCTIAASYLLLKRVSADDRLPFAPIPIAIMLAFVLHPLVLATAYHLSLNDALCAALILLAFRARERNQLLLAGAMIGVGALVKFYPIIFAPFLMIGDNRQLIVRLGVSAALTFIAGMGVAYIIWGGDIFTPFAFASERSAKLLSIFHFFESQPQLLGGEQVVSSLIDGNKYFVLGAAAGVYIVLFSIGARWDIAAVIGVLTIFTAYKVGHQQFYVTWLAVFAWMLTNYREPKTLAVAKYLAPAVIWLAIFQIVFEATDHLVGNQWLPIRDYVSVPTVIIMGAGIFLSIKAIWTKPSISVKIAW